ncbi:MAG: glycosyltransferase family 2 protein [Dokdonia sp.]|jgi:GT2 family glycosyltransferase
MRLKLSVIIVNYNVRYFLELCLKSVQAALTDISAEIIVVDNLSPDDSCAMVTSQFPEVQLIANTDNVGFAKANNQGVAIAKGEYVCILNPDTVVAEDTFTKILAFADNHPKAGAIGCRMIDGTGRFLPECKRNLPTPKVAFQKIFGNGDRYYARHIKAHQSGEVAILVGAFMLIRRAIYQEVGGFDEQYFMYGEDIDLSHTITMAGYQNYYFGATTIIHFKGESTARDATYRKRFYGAMQIFYAKHLQRNWIESSLVRLGLWYATLSRKRKPNTQTIAVLAYIVHTTAKTTYERLAAVLKAPLKMNNQTTEIQRGQQHILDANSHGYGYCIDLISKNVAQEATYKIIPKKSTFALGSDHSDGRGSIIHF